MGRGKEVLFIQFVDLFVDLALQIEHLQKTKNTVNPLFTVFSDGLGEKI